MRGWFVHTTCSCGCAGGCALFASLTLLRASCTAPLCARQALQVSQAHGGSRFEWSVDEEAKTRVWMARKTALWAANSLRPSCVALITDVCVPMSKFPEAISKTKQDIKASGLVAPIVGHAGDGACVFVCLGSSQDAAGLCWYEPIFRVLEHIWRVCV